MATIEEYQNAAPLITGLGVTKTQIENKLKTVPALSDPAPLPEVTVAKAVAVFDEMITDHTLTLTGKQIRQLASDQGLTVSQVKQIAREIKAMHSVYTNPQE